MPFPLLHAARSCGDRSRRDWLTGRGLPKKILGAGRHQRVWLISGASGQGAGIRDIGASLRKDLEV